jgi:uncharacterized protein
VTSAPPAGPIKARATRFDLTGTPSHWVPGHPYATHTLNTMHALLPPAERWFVDVYRDALPLITDARLRVDVEGFVAQETTHAKAHDRGLDAEELDQHGTDPQMLDLLRWHGAEEVEHRAVAFDLYQHLSGRYVRRAVHGAVMSLAIVIVVFGTAARLVALDPELDRRYRVRDYRDAVNAGTLPRVGPIVRSLADYLRRDHHPSQTGSPDRALAYLATSPGVVHRRAS